MVIGFGMAPFLNNTLIYISEIGNSKWKYISVIIILSGFPMAYGLWALVSYTLSKSWRSQYFLLGGL